MQLDQKSGPIELHPQPTAGVEGAGGLLPPMAAEAAKVVGASRLPSPEVPCAGDGPTAGLRPTYKTLADDGFPVMSRQTGLYRSIADETLSPLQHVDQALALQFEESLQTSLMSNFTGASVLATAALPVEDLQCQQRSGLDYWVGVAATLPRVEGEPFHASLIPRMDIELDLFDRGEIRHTRPLQVLALVRDSAEVTGTLHYDDAFVRKPDPALATMAHEALYAMQPQVHAEILNNGRIMAVLVGFWVFRSFSGCLGNFLPLWGNCLAILVIAWPLGPFLAILVIFGVTLAPRWPFLVSSASFWPFLSISVGLWSLHSPNRHTIDVDTLTTHLLWGPGHTQSHRRIFIFIGFGAACLLLLVFACYNLEASLESHHYK